MERNDNPLPAGFSCGPLVAEVALSNQYGTQQPYLPATAELPMDLDPGKKRVLYFTLGEPNPLVTLKKTPTLQDLADLFGGKAAPEPTFEDVAGLFNSSNWQHFMSPGSWGGARITGECVPQPEGQFLLTEKVPGPRARMVPGAPQ